MMECGPWDVEKLKGRRLEILKPPSYSTERGAGKGAIVVLIVVILILLEIGFKLFSNPSPTIEPAEAIPGIGVSRAVSFVIRDSHYRITHVQVAVLQDGHTFPAPVSLKQVPGPSSQKKTRFTVNASAQIGRREMPQLQQGEATIQVTAVNDSWGRFFRGGRRVFTMSVPVRFMPPQVEVLSPQQYVNLGGCSMVIFTVSAGTVRSGVQVGDYYFPSWPVKETQPQTRLALFAFPYNADPSTPAHILAEDDAGNKAVASFNYRVFPKKFPVTTLTLTDAFMQRVVPPILSQTTAIHDQGSLVNNYVEINRDLRKIDSQRIIQFSRETNPKFMWTQSFLRLPNTKAEANFADHRTYVYEGKVIDHEVHLGDDLASVAHSTVVAANDGLVIYAGWFDIFGNAVIIDHGCGLQTLYGHMASFKVKPGQLVKRGQPIGYSDSTGLAGGDHVHFEVMLDGVPVNPKEWWDPHWIHDQITAKLQQYGQ
jgi:murein DD-endopeptidase MepM/ murein hydrolase activator NlpD